MKNILTLSVIILLSAINIIQAQERIIYSSESLKCNDTVLVFSPQNVVDTPPALILLHGWSGNYNNWNQKAPLQELANEFRFRIICPDGFYNSWYLNSTDKDGMQWREFFFNEFLPDITKRYNLLPDKTFITGLSMGGHGAINIFIDHPELFRSAGSMSGVLDLNDTSLKDKWIGKIIGDDTTRIADESAVNRIVGIKNKIDEPLIITCGYNDVYVICSDKFTKVCRENDIPHIFMVSPGKHSWSYWNYALRLHLNHFRSIVNRDNLGY